MYDRGRQRPARDRRPCGSGSGRESVSATTFGAGRLILQLAFDAARETLAQQALALAVVDAIHGSAAGVAAVRGRRTRRFPHGVVTSGPITKNFRMPFCCVTTRRLGGDGAPGAPACGSRGGGLLFLRRFGCGCLPLASLSLRLGVLPASFSAGTAFLLPLRGLPAAHLLQTFRLSAVALVRTPGLESSPAAFAETSSPSQPPTPGRRAAFIGMLNLSHGR